MNKISNIYRFSALVLMLVLCLGISHELFSLNTFSSINPGNDTSEQTTPPHHQENNSDDCSCIGHIFEEQVTSDSEHYYDSLNVTTLVNSHDQTPDSIDLDSFERPPKA